MKMKKIMQTLLLLSSVFTMSHAITFSMHNNTELPVTLFWTPEDPGVQIAPYARPHTITYHAEAGAIKLSFDAIPDTSFEIPIGTLDQEGTYNIMISSINLAQDRPPLSEFDECRLNVQIKDEQESVIFETSAPYFVWNFSNDHRFE